MDYPFKAQMHVFRVKITQELWEYRKSSGNHIENVRLAQGFASTKREGSSLRFTDKHCRLLIVFGSRFRHFLSGGHLDYLFKAEKVAFRTKSMKTWEVELKTLEM